MFFKAFPKRNSFFYLSMERAGITICHTLANLVFKLFKKSPQDYNKSEAAKETGELNYVIYRVSN